VPTVSAVVVSFSNPSATRQSIRSLMEQAERPLEILVLDNHPEALTAAAMADWPEASHVRLVHSGENIGYAAACNRAASEARGDWLFFLNPDAQADPQCLTALLAAADARAGVVGAQVLMPDGRTNAGDNPMHLTGIAWAGRFGEPREHGPPRRVGAVSGAAMLTRASAYRELGGLCERFFMYYDDTDLCWRLRLAGWEVVFCPDAIVWHDYEFERGGRKWFLLERNRLWSVFSNYSLLSLWLLSPLLIGTEVVVAGFAIRQGWTLDLVRAWGSICSGLPALLRWRRGVQSGRRVPDRQIVELMSSRFETPLVRSRLALRADPLFALYRRGLLLILSAANR
jgi:GT2 family glycosyltransferase